MSAAMEHTDMSVVPLRPPTTAEQRRVEALLLQISADVGRLDAKVQGIADTQRDLREELRSEVRRLGADIKAISDQRTVDLRAADAQREADAPALSWAKMQRSFVFWLALTMAVALVTFAVDRLAGWGLSASVAGRFR
jgi:hypothetical protein